MRDAEKRGIENGDWVWVSTPRGRLKYQARVTEEIVEGLSAYLAEHSMQSVQELIGGLIV